MDFYANFRLISAGHQVLPALEEIHRNYAQFDNAANQARHTTYPELAETDVIYLRAPNRQVPARVPGDILECLDTAEQALFPKCMELVHQAFPMAGLGRVIISRMIGPSAVGTHIDAGQMAVQHHRHHICLCRDTATFTVGDKILTMDPGDVWEINNRRPHSVHNAAGIRIHFIVDTWAEYASTVVY